MNHLKQQKWWHRQFVVELLSMVTKTITNHQVTAHAPTTVAKILKVAIGYKLSEQQKTFGSTYRRLDPSKPSPTVTRSGYRDFIHPYEHRMLTVRELACLQSFPSNWVFKGVRLDSYSSRRQTTMTQFGQVGNAVPPLLAEVIARSIMEQFFPN
ncbi:MAG TPA: modification methylase [Candidatus Peribacter riflensis]|nr:modification methylase [Candidatus Peribacter riflensis]HBU09613.1 modification methylase [Candidatus Peribacter riflensis]